MQKAIFPEISESKFLLSIFLFFCLSFLFQKEKKCKLQIKPLV